MKKIICALIVALVESVAHCGPIANLDYIHTLIADRWNITIPFNRNITNINAAANMKYLLTTIDVANEILNGEPTTNYGNGEFATMFAADTIAVDTAVDGLIVEHAKPFCYTVTNGSSNNFDLSAAGTFTIDWGGVTETVTKTNVRSERYRCPSGAECKTVCISGTATDYSTTEAVLSFFNECSDSDMVLEAISGSLGAVFPTLPNGRQPLFIKTFWGCKIYSGLPDGLFDGIHGAPAADMFNSTFAVCGGGLTSIPEDLFSGISGPLASRSFYNTFFYTWSLTGPSARINGQYLYEIWPDATSTQVGGMYDDATGLSDYSSIPDIWK